MPSTSDDLTGAALLERVRQDFIGLDTDYPLISGQRTRRIYLDSTASTLMMRSVHELIGECCRHYANTHSRVYNDARISLRHYEWAHRRILSFVGADPERYACFFIGSGTTAGMNRMARVCKEARPDRDVAVVSIMEHHSNDLPHRKQMAKVIHAPLLESDGMPGAVCLKTLEEICRAHQERLNYVAITGASNVTGIVNPIHQIAEIAHRYGALAIVDGAQMAAHMPVNLCPLERPEQEIDAFVFSGHKTYVPGSPGVVIAKKELLAAVEPQETGGGMTQDVFDTHYIVKSDFPDREEAGTPNIVGAIGLAAAIDTLDRIGMQRLCREEEQLIESALEQLGAIPDVKIYGDTNPQRSRRIASIPFNVRGMDHGLVAAILNDYFNIAVRNACFCAHPYVKKLVLEELLESVDGIEEQHLQQFVDLRRGMVRASFGLYSTARDVRALAAALEEIVAHEARFAARYAPDDSGDYCHQGRKPDEADLFSVEAWMRARHARAA